MGVLRVYYLKKLADSRNYLPYLPPIYISWLLFPFFAANNRLSAKTRYEKRARKLPPGLYVFAMTHKFAGMNQVAGIRSATFIFLVGSAISLNCF
ncbi:hypothetical protein F4813DRAFT_342814 [Daldinia decipiens]|uniref:uncharacterized protein n=1 Tax=Daldinia decipiens TaxID=326647 RepID=UPI0020C36B61|nr:uncharacterized protein F4813DRAFT_342814 [Daldinia decipiens]KAI1663052.1 hypothetical protein F4813DRAFT_342814 [Daldinia decipiens]